MSEVSARPGAVDPRACPRAGERVEKGGRGKAHGTLVRFAEEVAIREAADEAVLILAASQVVGAEEAGALAEPAVPDEDAGDALDAEHGAELSAEVVGHGERMRQAGRARAAGVGRY